MYQERAKGLLSGNLTDLILGLKNSMNKKRTDFTLPINHSINITKY